MAYYDAYACDLLEEKRGLINSIRHGLAIPNRNERCLELAQRMLDYDATNEELEDAALELRAATRGILTIR